MAFTAVIAFALAVLVALPVCCTVFNVTVGGPGILRYDPEFVNADIGDRIVFTFKQNNLTVTQSTFENPCSLVENGFDTGFIPVSDNITEDFPTQSVSVQDTNPIWAYCRGHCSKGMVFAINPGDIFADFQASVSATNPSTTTTSTALTSLDIATVVPTVVTVTETLTANNYGAVKADGSFPVDTMSVSSTRHQRALSYHGQKIRRTHRH